jgi:hypothetical protein
MRSAAVFTRLVSLGHFIWKRVQTPQQGEVKQEINGKETVSLTKVWKYFRNVCVFLVHLRHLQTASVL